MSTRQRPGGSERPVRSRWRSTISKQAATCRSVAIATGRRERARAVKAIVTVARVARSRSWRSARPVPALVTIPLEQGAPPRPRRQLTLWAWPGAEPASLGALADRGGSPAEHTPAAPPGTARRRGSARTSAAVTYQQRSKQPSGPRASTDGRRELGAPGHRATVAIPRFRSERRQLRTPQRCPARQAGRQLQRSGQSLPQRHAA
jgi:hypothetical protein